MIRWLLLGVLLWAAAQAQTPVVVELFTSEGCSSCPPADLLLTKLENTQPVAGAHIIALSEHVDYWDRLGWRDPFSSLQFSLRQQEYAEALHESDPYTPEMVVDGVVGFIGSDTSRAMQAIANAARAPKTAMSVASASGKISINITGVPSPADILLAITESGLLSNVSAGENQGRRLTHSAVVRSLRVVGKTRSNEPFATDVAAHTGKSWKPEALRTVVILQDRSKHRILGAADAALTLE
jgi:hypothetical protein